jgi:magnesium chelatase family protein
MDGPGGEGSDAVRERVVAARERQAARLGPGRVNATMTPAETRRDCCADREGRELLAAGHRQLGLSGRGHERVLRVARTIADLAGRDRIDAEAITEALSLRRRRDGP